MTVSLVDKSHDGSEFHVFLASDFEDALLSRAILEQGWRLVAVYEVMTPMSEGEFNNGVSTSRNVLRPEARFLCVRGERGDLVEGLQRRVEALAADLLEAKKQIGVLKSEKASLQESVRRQERQLETLGSDVAVAREEQDKALLRLREVRLHHQKLETHFGAVRAAIGEIALKKILDAIEPSERRSEPTEQK